ncbi:hypothetical protein [Paenibacillus sp. CF384]|uniref:hypothetical protein n=1 Tax=Paenibacillus sp. CF384 TaxID=1884382 RepID=UPI00089DA6E0|nr:hypothetical protein [Paenibacillus sp. CF384]SDW56945.1 ABC-type polysaccharide transport system, permease component [Paenibacillus sp. CF384]
MLQRIWKYRMHYLLVIPPLLLWLIFKGIPFFMMLYGSFVNFVIFKGVFGSDWVGLDNFRNLFDLPEFTPILRNTLTMKLLYTAVSGIFALGAALALSGIGFRRLRGGLAALFLIPYFIPSAVIVYVTMLTLSQSQSPFGIKSMPLAHSEQFPWVLVAVEVIKTCGIPILIALTVIGARQAAMDNGSIRVRSTYLHRNVIPAMKAVTAFMLMQLGSLLTMDAELQRLLLNPLVYETGDTLESFGFRTVFMNAEYNLAGPLALFQFIVQFTCSLLAYFLIRGLFARDLFPSTGGAAALRSTGKGKNSAGILISVALSSAVLILLYLLFIYPFTYELSGSALHTLLSPYRYVIYMIMDLGAVTIFMMITAALAFPLTVKDLPGRGLYKLLLLALLTLGSSTFHEYLFYRDLHMSNTIFPLFFSGFYSILPIFVLKSIFNSKYSTRREEAVAAGRGETFIFFNVYMPSIWKPLLALGALHFVMLWSSFTKALVHLTNPQTFPPLMTFANAMNEIGEAGPVYSKADLLLAGAIISLPSLVILLLMRRWLTGEVMVSTMKNL